MQTKAVNLTEDEIEKLIASYGMKLANTTTDHIMERLNYLHKRLKAFKEVELTEVKSANTAAGWGTDNNA
jgi:hypothetical protein